MPPTPKVSLSGVWKGFRSGEVHDSLRDLLPALSRGWLKRRGGSARDEEDRFWALRDVGFAVEGGEALGIIGHNGAGKTTILRLLSRILRPDRGTIEVTGRVGAIIDVTAGFHPDLTGLENVYLGGSIMGMRRREVSSKLEQIIEFAGIPRFMDTPVKRYSSGMMARLGFSVCAHLDPHVLLVDEVLAVGDLAFQKKCYQFMNGLSSQGVAVILVSHDLAAIARLCPQTLVLSRGEAVFLGDTADAQSHYLELQSGTSSVNGYTLESFELLDGDGRANRTFTTGDRCTIRGLVRADVHCEALSLGVVVTQGAGLAVYHTTVQRQGSDPVDVAPGQVLELEGELTLNLAGGSYLIQVHGLAYDRPTREQFRCDACRFDIHEVPDFGGVANLEGRISQVIVD